MKEGQVHFCENVMTAWVLEEPSPPSPYNISSSLFLTLFFRNFMRFFRVIFSNNLKLLQLIFRMH